MNQAGRIQAILGSRGSRVDRVRNIAFRYFDNIRNANRNFAYRDSDYNVKYSRSTYMGLSNG